MASPFVTDSTLVLRAAQIALEAHTGQERQWVPAGQDNRYIQHPMRVVATLARDSHPEPTQFLQPVGEVDIAAAWLHDVLEDCKGWTVKRLREALLDGDSDPALALQVDETLVLVERLTNVSVKPVHKSKPRAERKRLDREALAQAGHRVWRIKLADRIDNLDHMAGAPENWRRDYANESWELYKVIKDGDPNLAYVLRDQLIRSGFLGRKKTLLTLLFQCSACKFGFECRYERDATDAERDRFTCPSCGVAAVYIEE